MVQPRGKCLNLQSGRRDRVRALRPADGRRDFDSRHKRMVGRGKGRIRPHALRHIQTRMARAARQDDARKEDGRGKRRGEQSVHGHATRNPLPRVLFRQTTGQIRICGVRAQPMRDWCVGEA